VLASKEENFIKAVSRASLFSYSWLTSVGTLIFGGLDVRVILPLTWKASAGEYLVFFLGRPRSLTQLEDAFNLSNYLQEITE
jgi:hypothetical protein